MAYLNRGIKDEKLICIIEKENSNEFREKDFKATACLIKEMNVTKDRKDGIQSSIPPLFEDLSPYQYIHHQQFIDTLNSKYRNEIIRILEDNLEA